jgi:hypothetical protein
MLPLRRAAVETARYELLRRVLFKLSKVILDYLLGESTGSPD